MLLSCKGLKAELQLKQCDEIHRTHSVLARTTEIKEWIAQKQPYSDELVNKQFETIVTFKQCCMRKEKMTHNPLQ